MQSFGWAFEPCQFQGMLTHPVLIKLARIAMRMSQKDLAEFAGVGERSVSRTENSNSVTSKSLIALQIALEKQGVTFLERDAKGGPGFRLPINWIAGDEDPAQALSHERD